MNNLTIALIAIPAAAAFAWMWSTVIRAPLGYQDDTGFHLGEPDNAVPNAEREARQTMPANVAAYFAEVAQIKAEQALQAEIAIGCARAKQQRLKNAAAAYKGIANAKGRA